MGPPAAPAAPPPPAAPVPGDAGGDTAGKLFAEIAALGESGVRSGLTKAVKIKASDRADAPAPVVQAKKLTKKAVNLGGTAKCALEGKKWIVEYQNGNKEIVIDATLKQTVYVFKCHDSLIQVKGKVNAIFLDKCTKTNCIFEEALASVEIVNSSDVQVQCTKNAPAMSIDGCTAVTYYMSSSFKQAKIITAKSAAINLIRPTEDDGKKRFGSAGELKQFQCTHSLTSNPRGDFVCADIVETPIPEQFEYVPTLCLFCDVFHQLLT